MSDQIKLGNKIRDVVTGLEGIAVSEVNYLNGSKDWGIRPKSNKDEMPGVSYIDSSHCEKIDEGIIVKTTKPQSGFRLPA